MAPASPWKRWISSTGRRTSAPFVQTQGQVAPNGRWLAYQSSESESGNYDVFVQSFPTPGAKWQISKNGGYHPRWRADGKELFYYAADGQLMAVSIAGDDAAL